MATITPAGASGDRFIASVGRSRGAVSVRGWLTLISVIAISVAQHTTARTF